MKTQKDVSIEDLKNLALTSQEAANVKGGGSSTGRGNVEVIVELIWD